MTATKERMIFVRRLLPSVTHTDAIELGAVFLPIALTPQDFLDFNREARAKITVDPKRQRVLAHEEVASDLKGATCTKYFLKTEDFGAFEKGGDPFLIIEEHGYSCLHPDQPTLVIHIRYSQRGKASEIDSSWNKVFEEFVKSFRFSPMKANPKE